MIIRLQGEYSDTSKRSNLEDCSRGRTLCELLATDLGSVALAHSRIHHTRFDSHDMAIAGFSLANP